MSGLIARAVKKVNDSYWLKSGSYTFMNKVFLTLFGFGNFFILIRILSKADFGAWVLFLSIAALMELIKHGFVRNPLIRHLALAAEKDSPRIQTASLFLNIIVGLAEFVFLILCSIYLDDFWDAPGLTPLFRIYAVSTLLCVPLNHFEVIQHAKMHFRGPFVSNFFRHMFLFLVIVTVFVFDFPVQLHHLAYAHLGGIILALLVSFTFAKRFLELSKTVDRKWVKELYQYGIFTLGTNVSSVILKSIDSWMLGKLISPVAVTIFNPAIRVSNLVEVPTDTLTSILFPKLSQRIASEGTQSAKYLYEKSVGTITAIMLPMVVFVILFASPIVLFIAGPGFEETVPILQVTMLFGLIIPFNRLMGITLDAIGKAKTNLMFVLRNMAINIISNFFFIGHFGIIGAAYGTFTTYSLVLIINQFYINRLVGVKIKNIFTHFTSAYAQVFSTGINIIRSALG